MPHRLKNLPDATKYRLLIALSGVSIALIILLWVVYLNWTLQSPVNESTPVRETSAIFKTGIQVIKEKIEIGFINTYLYFHNAFTEGRTFTITPSR